MLELGNAIMYTCRRGNLVPGLMKCLMSSWYFSEHDLRVFRARVPGVKLAAKYLKAASRAGLIDAGLTGEASGNTRQVCAGVCARRLGVLLLGSLDQSYSTMSSPSLPVPTLRIDLRRGFPRHGAYFLNSVFCPRVCLPWGSPEWP